MFKKIAIANRGEIALRILRTCKEMGIPALLLHSEADADSLPVLLAEESICIGKASASQSYLQGDLLIQAALAGGADAIHPGYGFLSENADFAEKCGKAGITFIGPSPDAIRKMGNKAEARKQMLEAGVPVVPGSEGSTTNGEEALKAAEKIGFPVMIKASSGGGGRGMRIIHDPRTFLKEFMLASKEAAAAFQDGAMYVEKFIEEPRHVEFQILADSQGNVLHLGERDCSIQRRNQKIIEEAPCVILRPEVRKKMGEAAIAAAKWVGYTNAGTVEFLLDKNQKFYFIEMNTRIQVEHPVTEMITGLDLIREQISIAAGMPIKFAQEEVFFRGHAIECRINAEDCSKNFMPSPGRVEKFFLPGGFGIRVDSHVYNGYFVPPHYDSMIGKLIVWGENREQAIQRMQRALEEIVITGISTNIEFHQEILSNDRFQANEITTGFITQSLNRQIS